MTVAIKLPGSIVGYTADIEDGGTVYTSRASGVSKFVPFGQPVKFDDATKISKNTLDIASNIQTHLEAYPSRILNKPAFEESWSKLVAQPTDMVRTQVNFYLNNDLTAYDVSTKVPATSDKIVVGYVNAMEININDLLMGLKTFDKNNDGSIDPTSVNLPDYADINAYNKDWNLYVAKYWTESWRQKLKLQIDTVAAQNFDGLMLDVMTGHNTWMSIPGNIYTQDFLRNETVKLFKWISEYAKSTYGNAFIISANIDPLAYQYFSDLGEVIDVGYYQNSLFNWNGSGDINQSVFDEGWRFLKIQGLPLLAMDHLGTGIKST